MAQRRDVPKNIGPFLRIGVFEGGVGALLYQVADIKSGLRANEKVPVCVTASKVE